MAEENFRLDRRKFVAGLMAAGAALAAQPFTLLAKSHPTKHSKTAAHSATKDLLVSTGTPDGILHYAWNSATGELTEGKIAATVPYPVWITLSPDRQLLYAACEVPNFDGKPTGGVASFRLHGSELQPLSHAPSAGPGTCHVAVDETGRVLVAADYGGGSAASFLCEQGRMGDHVWSETYSGSGPVASRQEKAHAHFASFSPDGRFAYINDLGSDCIHIYAVDVTTAKLTPAGTFHSHPGAGPRTLHFHPNRHTGYVVNELDSTVDVVELDRDSGSLARTQEINLLPDGYTGPTRACDAVITKDGRFAYFANRDNNFLYSFRANPVNGKLTSMARTPAGGNRPRHFTLDPTERWMLVANQDSNYITVFARNPKTGELASEGKNYAAKVPMSLVFI